MPQTVKDFIAHYADQYYNPQAAHQYYLETRTLKGRTPKETENQKEAETYAQKTITDDKTRDLATEKNTETAKIAALTAKAKQVQSQIETQIKAFIAQVTDSSSPLSVQERASMSKTQGASLSNQFKAVETQLKGALSAARSVYTASRDATETKYATAAKTEKAKILANVS